MAETTIEVEKIELAIVDKVTSAAQSISGSLDGIQKKLESLPRRILTSTAGFLGLSLGIRELGRQVIHANESLEATQKRIAGTFFAYQKWDKSVSTVERVDLALAKAKKTTDALEESETKLAIPLETLGSIYGRIAGPAFSKLRMSQQQVIKLTEQAAAAAKVYGISGEMAASTIARAMLTKTVRGIDPFSQKLKMALGDMRKLSSAEIYNRIRAQMQDMVPAAERMSKGFTGTMFRLRDFIEDTLRDVGKPTFEYIAKKIEEWRTKLMAVTDSGKTIAEVYGEKILNAFKAIEKVAGFIVEHWRVIIAYLASRQVSGFIGGLQSGLAGGLAKGGAAAAAGAGGGLAGAAGIGLPLLALAAQSAADAINDMHAATVDNRADMEGMSLAFKKLNEGTGTGTRQAIKIAKAFGVIDEKGQVMTERLKTMLESLSTDKIQELAKSLGFLKRGTMNAANVLEWFTETVAITGSEMGGGEGTTPGLTGLERFKKFKPWDPKVNKVGDQNFYGDIHITQDFKDQDPDRVFIRFKSDLENLAINPTQSNSSTPTGM